MTANEFDLYQDMVAFAPEDQIPGHLQDLGFFGTTGDIAKSTLYGGEQAVRSMFDLASYTFGGDTSEIEDSFFTAPQTVLGQFTGAFAQFAAGSVITGGLIQGGLATLTALGVGLGSIFAAPVVAGGAALGGIALTTARIAKGWNTYRRLKKHSKVFNYAHAGMVDFAAFRGEQGRFVDLLEDHAGINNAVFSWISGDVDDSEFEGRIKNMLDGVIAGGMLDAAVKGIKRAAGHKKRLGEKLESGEPMTDAQRAELEAEFDLEVRQGADLELELDLMPQTENRVAAATRKMSDPRYADGAQKINRILLDERPEGAAGIRDFIAEVNGDLDDVIDRVSAPPGSVAAAPEVTLKQDAAPDADIIWNKDNVFRSGQEPVDFEGTRGGVRGNPFDQEEGFILEMDPKGFREDQRYLDDNQSSPEELVVRGEVGDVKTIYYNHDFWDGGHAEALADLIQKHPQADVAFVKVDPDTGNLKYAEPEGDFLDELDEALGALEPQIRQGPNLGQQLNVNQRELRKNEAGQYIDENGEVIEGLTDEILEVQGKINFSHQDMPDLAARTQFEIVDEFKDELKRLRSKPRRPKKKKGAKQDADEALGDEQADLFNSQAEAHDAIVNVFGSNRAAREVLTAVGDQADNVRQAARMAERLRVHARNLTRYTENLLEDAVSMDTPQAHKAVRHGLATLFAAQAARQEIASALGYGLGSLGPRLRRGVSNMAEKAMRKVPGREGHKELLDYYDKLVLEATKDSASEAAKKHLAETNRKILKLLRNSPDLGSQTKQLEGVLASAPMSTGNLARGVFKALPEIFVTNVISGPKTLAIGVLSPMFVYPTRALAELYGRAFELQAKADPEFAVKMMRETRDDFTKMTLAVKNSLEFTRLAMKGDMSRIMSDVGLASEMREGRQVDRLAGSVADRMGWQTDGVMRNLFRVGYNTLVPGRILPARIDRIQQLSVYKSEYYVGALRAAQNKGMSAGDAEDFAEWMTDMAMNKPDELAKQFSGDAIGHEAAKLVEEGRFDNQNDAIADVAARFEVERQDHFRIAEGARRKAQATTYNRPLKELLEERDAMSPIGAVGTEIANAVSGIVKQHPTLRLFAPFLTIPTNIMVTSTETLVGGTYRLVKDNLSKQMMDVPGLSGDLDDFIAKINSPNASIRRQAVGQSYVAANMVGAFGFLLAQPGIVSMDGPGALPMITGSGPVDANQRRAWLNAGWQPFSIRVGDKYYSYQRVEPFATWLGFMTDMVQVAQYQQYRDDPDSDELLDVGVVAAMTAMTKQLTEKTFMQGLQDLTNLLEADVDSNVEWAKRTLSSILVPASIRQTTLSMDPVIRDARTVGDKLMQSIPGMSQRLDSKRDLLGEKIKRGYLADSPWFDAIAPTRVTDIKDDVVRNEFLQVPNDWRSMPTRYKGVNLLDARLDINGISAYDAWQEQVSTVKLRGRTMRQSLRILFQDPEYQALDPSPTTFGQDSGRVLAINRVMNAYKRAAFVQLAKDNPQLEREFKAVRQAARDRSRARRNPSPTLID